MSEEEGLPNLRQQIKKKSFTIHRDLLTEQGKLLIRRKRYLMESQVLEVFEELAEKLQKIQKEYYKGSKGNAPAYGVFLEKLLESLK